MRWAVFVLWRCVCGWFYCESYPPMYLMQLFTHNINFVSEIHRNASRLQLNGACAFTAFTHRHFAKVNCGNGIWQHIVQTTSEQKMSFELKQRAHKNWSMFEFFLKKCEDMLPKTRTYINKATFNGFGTFNFLFTPHGGYFTQTVLRQI